MIRLHVRLAGIDDAPVVSRLALRVARRWIMPGLSPAGVLTLEKSLSTRVVRQKIASGQRFHLAWVGHVLVGVVAVRDDSHIFQFFVSTRYQGRGIARKLWERLRRDSMRRAGTRAFTLNAAPGALPVYLHLGFVCDPDPRRLPGRIFAIPMIYRARAGR